MNNSSLLPATRGRYRLWRVSLHRAGLEEPQRAWRRKGRKHGRGAAPAAAAASTPPTAAAIAAIATAAATAAATAVAAAVAAAAAAAAAVASALDRRCSTRGAAQWRRRGRCRRGQFRSRAATPRAYLGGHVTAGVLASGGPAHPGYPLRGPIGQLGSFEGSPGLCSKRPRESVRVPLLARSRPASVQPRVAHRQDIEQRRCAGECIAVAPTQTQRARRERGRAGRVAVKAVKAVVVTAEA